MIARVLIGLASLVMLAACVEAGSGNRDLGGRNLGQGVDRTIEFADSRITYYGSPSDFLSIQSRALPDRYLEAVRMQNGQVFYERLNFGGYSHRTVSREGVLESFNGLFKLERDGFPSPSIQMERTARGVIWSGLAQRGTLRCGLLQNISGSRGFQGDNGNRILSLAMCNSGSPDPVSDVKALFAKIDLDDEGRANKGRVATAPPAATNTPSQMARNAVRRPLAIQWEGFSQPIAGEIELIEAQQQGRISFILPSDGTTCSGNYEFSADGNGKWWASCAGNLSAAGTFRILGSGMNSTGDGIDSRGRKIRFTIGSAGRA